MDPRDEPLLQDLLDDRLGEAEAAQVRARLEAEPALRDAYDELQAVGRLLRGGAAERAPHDFLTRVRERIAAAPAEAAEDPPLPRLSAWRRAAVVASALAALLLVAVAVRLMFGGGMPRAESPAVESARKRSSENLDRVGERTELGTPDAVARPRGGAAAPMAPREGYGPGDAVPPGLREPHDGDAEAADAFEGEVRRGLVGLVVPENLAPAARTYAFRATGYAEGRARLALIVGGLETAEKESARGGAGAATYALEEVGKDLGGEVLGSVVLTLSPRVADALAALGPHDDRDKRSTAEPAPTPSAAPPTPAAPAAPKGPESTPGSQAPGDTAAPVAKGMERADAEKAEAKGPSAETVRVRIVFVR